MIYIEGTFTLLELEGLFMTQKKYYTLRNDIIFKNTFNDEVSLKKLLKETLNMKVNKILKINTEQNIDNKNERRKYLDLILETDKGIVNVEINYGYKEELPNRNLLYLCKLISASIKKNNSYVNIDKHIQLNITWNLSKYLGYDIKDRKILKYHLSDDKTHDKIYKDVFEIVHVNMDYFEDVWYHGNTEKENPFLMLLAAPTEEEMDKISEGDKLMEELNNKVKRLNQDSDVLDVIIENEEEIINNSLYEIGVKNGITQGISQGKREKQLEMARNMLRDKLDIDIISKYTGLSKKEIENI